MYGEEHKMFTRCLCGGLMRWGVVMDEIVRLLPAGVLLKGGSANREGSYLYRV